MLAVLVSVRGWNHTNDVHASNTLGTWSIGAIRLVLPQGNVDISRVVKLVGVCVCFLFRLLVSFLFGFFVCLFFGFLIGILFGIYQIL